MRKGLKNREVGPVGSPDKLNRIVDGTSIKGDINTDSNFRLDGYLNGTLESSGKVVVGPSGKIEGEVVCANADIEGEIIGNLKVDGLLILKSTAKVIGNITAGKIGIENGAEFNGNCNMSGLPVQSEQIPIEANGAESESELVY
ncbi:MAG: polymer-forming cytoskeletal protein [Crocinitomicaceae bacterium]|nr:polymer-forming cytoskeletal protein [Crocinitomicaceae bacterium]